MNDWNLDNVEWGSCETATIAKSAKQSDHAKETEDKKLRLYKEKTCHILGDIKKMGIPKAGEQIRLITKDKFNALAFVQWIIDSEGVIEDIIFCTFSLNYEAGTIINDLVLSGKIKKATIILNVLRNTMHNAKEGRAKRDFISNPNIELIYVHSHAKIISFKIKDNYYTIEGSGNLSYSARIEQYIIDNDKVVYDFTRRWIKEIKEYLKDKKELKIYT